MTRKRQSLDTLPDIPIPNKSRIEQDAREKQQQIQQAADERTKEVIQVTQQERDAIRDTLDSYTKTVEGNLEDSNSYLLQVGEDMRK